MGWEYRYFVPLPDDRAALLRRSIGGQLREDVYFPCSATVGVKVRNGDLEELEVKTMVESQALQGDAGNVEKWKKVSLRGHVTDGGDAGPRLSSAAALAHQLGGAEQDLWAAFEGSCPALRVFLLKDRTRTAFGEVTDILLRAFGDGHEQAVLEETYCTYCMEIGNPTKVQQRLADDAALRPPAGAFLGGYPALVVEFTKRALAALAGAQGQPVQPAPLPREATSSASADGSHELGSPQVD